MSDELRLEKIYRAGQSSYKASSELNLTARYLQNQDEEELRERAMELERKAKELHREIDAKVGGKK